MVNPSPNMKNGKELFHQKFDKLAHKIDVFALNSFSQICER